MGYAVETDVIVALAVLEQVLADLGVPVELGAAVRAAQQVFTAR
jgi:aspartate aminotransferase-like enzyme